MIGMIAPPWYPIPPGKYGGTENVIDGLCRGLGLLGEEVILVAAMGSRCPVPTVQLRVSYDLAMGHALTETPYVLQAYEVLRDRGVDVIHDHSQVGFLMSGAEVPIITTNHNQFNAPRKAIYREAAARGVKIVAISVHHASTAAPVPIDRIIYNGTDVAGIPVGAGKGGYACVLSRMAPAKGIHEAIMVAQAIGMPLRIAAKMQTAAEHQYFKNRVYPHLGGDIQFESEVSAKEKFQLLGDAVCLINPIQWHEPFGLAMIESLACGTPVLSTLMGSAPEIVDHGKTGFLRNQWSMMPADLERVGSVIDREECRRAAEDRFSIRQMAANYRELYYAS